MPDDLFQFHIRSEGVFRMLHAHLRTFARKPLKVLTVVHEHGIVQGNGFPHYTIFSAEIFHADIKPENVVISGFGVGDKRSITLIDLGFGIFISVLIKVAIHRRRLRSYSFRM
jgi:serine/threonine protein kinase